MPDSPHDDFVDAIGLHFEAMGAPKMMGRILAWLMVCEPPVQSSQQLMDQLQTTSGTISTNTRLLMLHELIERVEVPGTRASHFRLVPDASQKMMQAALKDILGWKAAADRAVESMGSNTPPAVSELAEFSEFLLNGLSDLMVAWQEKHP